MERGDECPGKRRLRGGLSVLALQCCGKLTRSIEVGVAEVTGHEKIRTLEIVPIRDQHSRSKTLSSPILTRQDPVDLESGAGQ